MHCDVWNVFCFCFSCQVVLLNLSLISVTNTGYMGCFIDKRDRALPKDFISDRRMNIEMCLRHCESKGHTYAGVQYGQECWCGNENDNPKRYGGKRPEKECGKPCKGNRGEKCGGDWRQNVWKLGKIESIIFLVS